MLDTDMIIYIIKKQPPRVVERFRQFSQNEIILSSISIAELERGARKSSNYSKNKKALLDFSSPFQIYNFDFKAAEKFGKISAELESKGKKIGAYDTLIAAHAVSVDATIVTNNINEFKRVSGLNVEKWTM